MLFVGVPGGHALFGDDFSDHCRPRRHVLVGHEPHRADLTGPMALLATVLDDGSDVLRISNFCLGDRRRCATDEAAGHRRCRYANSLPGQHFVGSNGEIVAIGLGPQVTGPELVIDPALVADLEVGVEDEGLRCAVGAEVIGGRMAPVLEHREGNAVFLGVFRNFPRSVLLVAVDGKKKDAFFAVNLVQLRQARHVAIVDGALGAQEEDDNSFVALEIPDCPSLARGVLKVELGNLRAKVCDRRSTGNLLPGTEASKQQRRGTCRNQKTGKHRGDTDMHGEFLLAMTEAA